MNDAYDSPCSLELKFPIAKVLDHARDAKLGAKAEPMALVVAAHLATRATKGDPHRRLAEKLRICRRLYERGLSKEEILELYRLIDWLLTLPRELEQEFLARHGAFEEAMSMQYITSAERLGMQQGMAKGMAKGMQQGMAGMLERLLRKRFGFLNDEVLASLRQASTKQLDFWADRALEAPDLQSVFASSADEAG